MTRSAEAQTLSLGILARSRKPNERRLPIHPAHFSRIDSRVRSRIFLEHGYGAEFGATDDALADLVGESAPENNSSPDATSFSCRRSKPRIWPNSLRDKSSGAGRTACRIPP